MKINNSFFSFRAQVSVQEAFEKAVRRVEKEGRVSNHTINFLLKAAKNSPRNFTVLDCQGLEHIKSQIIVKLEGQNSAVHAEKYEKINGLVDRVIENLSPDVKSDFMKEKYLVEKLKIALVEVEESISLLEENMGSEFGCPIQGSDVKEKKNDREIESEKLKNSTELKSLKNLKEFLSHPDNLDFHRSLETGKLELTEHQRHLVNYFETTINDTITRRAAYFPRLNKH
ncbi:MULTISPECIES: hypothetical protein [Pseudomonas]|uniref:Uncharacterized protein n=1 Tax=Pseudomonas quercus TaxID=2722792 RepID=A0ABX0YCW5_9PSED|nr:MULTISPECIES: hypothetical protein [Pseudomonas]MBF7142569.1 hypothetical protein [Pseudomonas sp. LY10J]NJP01107.1 hypothetical protein [Pseudomonas quercus]